MGDCFVAHKVIISIKIIKELLAMTDQLINKEMGRVGGKAANPSHLPSILNPPVIARNQF